MHSILKTSIVISFFLFLGRLSGFARELTLANTLGISTQADAAIIILTFPDFMVGILLSGGFSAALIPLFKQFTKPDRIKLMRLIKFNFSIISLLLTCVLIFYSKFIISLLLPSLDLASAPHIFTAFKLTCLILPIAVMIGINTSYLNTIGIFAVPIISVFIFNLIIIFYLLMDPFLIFDLQSLSVVIFIGFLFRLAIQMYYSSEIFSTDFKNVPKIPKEFKFTFLQGSLSYSIIFGIGVLYRTLFAVEGDGNVALFNYSLKIVELPIALIIVPVTMVLLPKLSEMNKTGDVFIRHYTSACNIGALTIITIATVVGITFIPSIINLLFSFGSIEVDGTLRIQKICVMLMMILPAVSIFNITITALFAQGKSYYVFLITVVCLIISLLCYAVLLQIKMVNYAAPFGLITFYYFAAIFSSFLFYGITLPNVKLVRSFLSILIKCIIFSYSSRALISMINTNSLLIEFIVALFVALSLIILSWSNIKPLVKLKFTDK